MDRFIENDRARIQDNCDGLKSNMDRFIVSLTPSLVGEKVGLKSNMDRFIDILKVINDIQAEKFKIQYGQIYRETNILRLYVCSGLKSNMDRFIGH